MAKSIADRIAELRQEAEKAYRSMEWQPIGDSPTTKYYTDWHVFEKHVAVAEPVEMAGGDGCKPRGDENVALIGGHIRVTSLPQDVELYTHLDAGETSYTSLLGGLVKPTESRHFALHYRFLTSAVVVVFPRGVEAKLHLSLCTPYAKQPAWNSNHVVIVVEKGSKARLIVEDYSLNGFSGYSTVLEAYLEENSSLELFTLAPGAARAPSMNIQRFSLNKGSSLVSSLVGSGGLMHRVEGLALLRGEKAKLVHRGLVVGRREERADYIYDVAHFAPKTYSRPLLYGIALDSSTVVVRGNSRVSETAKWSDTVLEASVLILGDRARGYSAPMMEIDTGDVETAVHHAANYRIRGDQLFYLQSRGLTYEESSALLVRGISEKTIEHLQLLRDEAAKLSQRILAA